MALSNLNDEFAEILDTNTVMEMYGIKAQP